MSRFKFPNWGAGFLLVCTRQRQTQRQQSYEGGFIDYFLMNPLGLRGLPLLFADLLD